MSNNVCHASLAKLGSMHTDVRLRMKTTLTLMFIGACVRISLAEPSPSNTTYAGVGAVVWMTNAIPEIIRVIDGGPAQMAGIKPRSVILSIDGHTTESNKLVKVVRMLRGPAGSKVTLTIRDAESATRTLTLTREQLRVISTTNVVEDEPDPADIKIEVEHRPEP